MGLINDTRKAYLQRIIDGHYRSYHDEDIEVKQVSQDVGLGVFAVRDFFPGQLIIEIRGQIHDAKSYEGSHYCMELSEEYTMEPDAPGALVNHSCSPNSILLSSTDYTMAIVAQTYISAGTQITYDYGWEPSDDLPRCHCGSPVCRGWPVALGKGLEMQRMMQRFDKERNKKLPRIKKSGSVTISDPDPDDGDPAQSGPQSLTVPTIPPVVRSNIAPLHFRGLPSLDGKTAFSDPKIILGSSVKEVKLSGPVNGSSRRRKLPTSGRKLSDHHRDPAPKKKK